MKLYERLEREFRDWSGSGGLHCVACSSGTAALHLALEALELPTNSPVLVPEFTMVACARAVTLAGLRPSFVDCDDQMLLDVGSTRFRLPRRAKAIMPVHIYGRRCNMVAVANLAGVNQLAIVEDLAEAHGVAPHASSDAACWSFYRNKIVAGEEGGMVGFRDPVVMRRAMKLRNMGWTDAHDCRHVPRGHNYRLANLLAEPILQSLHRYLENAQRRGQVEQWYDAVTPDEWKLPRRDAVWVYDLRIPGMQAEVQSAVVKELNRRGIAARHGFKPMSCQDEYRNSHGYRHLNAWRFGHEVIYLPVDPGYTEADCTGAVATLQKIYGNTS